MKHLTFKIFKPFELVESASALGSTKCKKTATLLKIVTMPVISIEMQALHSVSII